MKKSDNKRNYRITINLETAENLKNFREFQRLLLFNGRSLSDYLMVIAGDYKNRHHTTSQADLLTQSEILSLAKKMRVRFTDSELCNYRKRRFTENKEFIKIEINGRSRYFYFKKAMTKFFKSLKMKRRTAKKNLVSTKPKVKKVLPETKPKKPLIKTENVYQVVPMSS